MKLIDKDALVAEIERRKNYYENIQMIKPVYESNIEDFNELLSFINTLEVKEVDLCKEEERIWKDFNMGERHLSKNDLEKISKYFFELGMQVSNKAQKNEG